MSVAGVEEENTAIYKRRHKLFQAKETRTKIFNAVKFSNVTSPLCTIKSTCLITVDNLENIVFPFP